MQTLAVVLRKEVASDKPHLSLKKASLAIGPEIIQNFKARRLRAGSKGSAGVA